MIVSSCSRWIPEHQMYRDTWLNYKAHCYNKWGKHQHVFSDCVLGLVPAAAEAGDLELHQGHKIPNVTDAKRYVPLILTCHCGRFKKWEHAREHTNTLIHQIIAGSSGNDKAPTVSHAQCMKCIHFFTPLSTHHVLMSNWNTLIRPKQLNQYLYIPTIFINSKNESLCCSQLITTIYNISV